MNINIVGNDDFKTVRGLEKAGLTTCEITHCILTLALSKDPKNHNIITLGHFYTFDGQRDKLREFISHMEAQHVPEKTVIAVLGGLPGRVEDEGGGVYNSELFITDLESELSRVSFKIAYKDVLNPGRIIHKLVFHNDGKADIEVGVTGEKRTMRKEHSHKVSMTDDKDGSFLLSLLTIKTPTSIQLNYSGFIEPHMSFDRSLLSH